MKIRIGLVMKKTCSEKVMREMSPIQQESERGE